MAARAEGSWASGTALHDEVYHDVSPGLSIIPSESSSRQEDGGVGTCTSFCEHNTRLPHTLERRLRSLAGAKIEGFHSRRPSLDRCFARCGSALLLRVGSLGAGWGWGVARAPGRGG